MTTKQTQGIGWPQIRIAFDKQMSTQVKLWRKEGVSIPLLPPAALAMMANAAAAVLKAAIIALPEQKWIPNADGSRPEEELLIIAWTQDDDWFVGKRRFNPSCGEYHWLDESGSYMNGDDYVTHWRLDIEGPQ